MPAREPQDRQECKQEKKQDEKQDKTQDNNWDIKWYIKRYNKRDIKWEQAGQATDDYQSYGGRLAFDRIMSGEKDEDEEDERRGFI